MAEPSPPSPRRNAVGLPPLSGSELDLLTHPTPLRNPAKPVPPDNALGTGRNPQDQAQAKRIAGSTQSLGGNARDNGADPLSPPGVGPESQAEAEMPTPPKVFRHGIRFSTPTPRRGR